jgi:RHS repeat-associated protein
MVGGQREWDVESQYDYFGARYYDSRIGRWLGVDPLLDEYQGLSPFSYVANNPLNSIDPDGRAFNLLAGAIGGVVGFAAGTLANAFDQYSKTGDVDWKKAVNYGVGGMVAGGMAGITFGASLAATGLGAAAGEAVAGCALGNAAGGIATRALNGETPSTIAGNMEAVAQDAAIGAGTGLLAGPAGEGGKALVKSAVKASVDATAGMSKSQVAGAKGAAVVHNAGLIILGQTVASEAVSQAGTTLISPLLTVSANPSSYGAHNGPLAPSDNSRVAMKKPAGEAQIVPARPKLTGE